MSEEINGTKTPHIGVTSIVFTAVAVIALVALVLVLVLFRSQADDASQSAVVGNTAPTVDTVTTAVASLGADQATITPTENTTKAVYVHGTATDNNGCQDINNSNVWVAKMYGANAADGLSCTLDNNNCYNPASITLTGCTGAGDLNLTYEALFNLQYYTTSTDAGSPEEAANWVGYIKAVDAASANGTNTDTYEFGSLLAFDVTGAVNFGTVALGADSTQQTITFTSTGNRTLDLDQSSSGNMICDGTGSNNIPVGNAHISLTNGFTYGTGDQAVGSGSIDLTLLQRTDDSTPSTKPAYLKLRMPATGVRGTCTNTITLTAAQNS